MPDPVVEHGTPGGNEAAPVRTRRGGPHFAYYVHCIARASCPCLMRGRLRATLTLSELPSRDPQQRCCSHRVRVSHQATDILMLLLRTRPSSTTSSGEAPRHSSSTATSFRTGTGIGLAAAGTGAATTFGTATFLAVGSLGIFLR